MESNSFGEGNDNSLNSKRPENEPRFFKLVIGTFIVLFVFVGGFAFYKAYKVWTAQQKIEDLAEALRNWEKENYKRQLADTYGGKTPQETLQMYIEAVEKGDYELASKYFIEDKRDDELKSLQNSLQRNIDNVQSLLRKSLTDNLSCNEKRVNCAFHNPLLVEFVLYPSGIWKIVEI